MLLVVLGLENPWQRVTEVMSHMASSVPFSLLPFAYCSVCFSVSPVGNLLLLETFVFFPRGEKANGGLEEVRDLALAFVPWT